MTDKVKKTMKVEAFLYIQRSGAVRATKSRCTIKEGEIRTRIEINVPESLFDHDVATFKISIPDKVQQAIIEAEATEASGSW